LIIDGYEKKKELRFESLFFLLKGGIKHVYENLCDLNSHCGPFGIVDNSQNKCCGLQLIILQRIPRMKLYRLNFMVEKLLELNSVKC